MTRLWYLKSPVVFETTKLDHVLFDKNVNCSSLAILISRSFVFTVKRYIEMVPAALTVGEDSRVYIVAQRGVSLRFDYTRPYNVIISSFMMCGSILRWN